MALNFENVGLTEIIPGLTKSGGVDESIQLDSAITNGVGGQPLFAAFGDESKASTGSAVSAAVKRKVSITLSGNVTSATSLTFTGGADTTAVTIAAEDTPSEVAAKVVGETVKEVVPVIDNALPWYMRPSVVIPAAGAAVLLLAVLEFKTGKVSQAAGTTGRNLRRVIV